MTAREFLSDASSKEFRQKCEGVGIEATVRQVRKYRNKRGAAYTGIPVPKKK